MNRVALWKPCAFARPESPNSGPDRRDTSAADAGEHGFGVATHPSEQVADAHERVVAQLLDLVMHVVTGSRERRQGADPRRVQLLDVSSEGVQRIVHGSILHPPTDIRMTLEIALIRDFACA